MMIWKPIFALLLCCSIFAFTVLARERNSDQKPIDVTTPGIAGQSLQVMSTEDLKQLWTEAEQLRTIQQQLSELNSNVKEMQKDIRILMDTNIIVNFLLGIAKLLVPGLLITAFGFWCSEYIKKRNRRKPSPA